MFEYATFLIAVSFLNNFIFYFLYFYVFVKNSNYLDIFKSDYIKIMYYMNA